MANLKTLSFGVLFCSLLMGCDRRDATVSPPLEQVATCNRAADCDDSNGCTVDRCTASSRCVHGSIPGCCQTDVDCDDKAPCTEDRCDTTSRRCRYTAVAGCCGQATPCDDRNACTMDACTGVNGTCGYTPVAGCCRFSSDCDDMDPCTENFCDASNRCTFRPKAGCCRQNSDCIDSSGCTDDTCDLEARRCVHTGIANCCNGDADCVTGDPCSQGRCGTDRRCTFQWPNNCCASDADCEDGSPCTRDICNTTTRICRFEAVSGGGCCATELDCDDRDVCTAERCDDGTHQCVYSPSGACCNVDGECDDRDLCTTDFCDLGAHLCRHNAVPNCQAGDAGVDAATPSLAGSGGCAVAPGIAAGTSKSSAETARGLALFLVLLALARLRRRWRGLLSRRNPRHGLVPSAVLALTIGLLGRTSVAHADGMRPIDAQLFHQAPSWDRYFTLDGAAPPGKNLFNLVVGMSYSRRPLLAETSTGVSTVIPYQIGMDLVPSIGLWNRLMLYVGIPLIAHRDTMAPLSQRGIGDVRLGFKLHLAQLEFEPGFAGIAFSTRIILPTGDKDGFGSGGVVQVEPSLTFDVRHNRWGFAARGGLLLREEQRAFNLTLGHAASVAAGVRAPLWSDAFVVVGEIYGWIPLAGGVSSRTSPFEALGGVRLHLSALDVTVGAGRGITTAYGTSDVRLLASVAFSPEPPPKPYTAYAPDPSWVASVERIPSSMDFPPLKDKDGDGILDGGDRCPTEPGPTINEGCPDRDTDSDGLVDRLDRCPQDREVFNGVADDDGCPDEGAPLVALTEKKVEIKQPIFFETSRAVIDPRSYLVLQAVASILRLHPDIRKVRVEGHTDRRGKPQKNMELSQRRAEAVRSHLVLVHGIAPDRLEAKGFGMTRPVAPNLTRAGRSLNRRVEFVIVDRAAEGPNAAPSQPEASPGGTNEAPPAKPAAPHVR